MLSKEYSKYKCFCVWNVRIRELVNLGVFCEDRKLVWWVVLVLGGLWYLVGVINY